MTPTDFDKRLLVFDCHEAWVYQLRLLERPMDIVVGLRGRAKSDWDTAMRPFPANARAVRGSDLANAAGTYHCIVAHNLTDLLDVRVLAGPRILVLHETLDGTAREQGSTIPLEELRRGVAQFIRLTRTHVVAVSNLKGKSWGFCDDVVTACADPDDYPAWEGDAARGLRIANHVLRRPQTLLWELHEQAFGGLPVTLVGHNPEMTGVQAAEDWPHLKELLRHHRFYIHTADPRFEDGYNMAMLEAMGAGLPVVGNRHPTSPIRHGENGFLSDDAAELRGYATRLLADRDLAARMGAAARETVARQFSPSHFKEGFARSIAVARKKWGRDRQEGLERPPS